MPDVLTVEASEEDQDAVRDLFMRALNLALDGLIGHACCAKETVCAAT